MWSCPYLLFFTNKILIEKEDSEKQYSPHYADNHAGINNNWNWWLAEVTTIFSTHVSYLIGQKFATGFLAIQKFMWSYPCLLLCSKKILIEKEDHYDDDYFGTNANWNSWLAQVATIFSTHVSYAIGQKCATGFSAIQKFIWSYSCLLLFTNKILIEREDSEKHHSLHYELA